MRVFADDSIVLGAYRIAWVSVRVCRSEKQLTYYTKTTRRTRSDIVTHFALAFANIWMRNYARYYDVYIGCSISTDSTVHRPIATLHIYYTLKPTRRTLTSGSVSDSKAPGIGVYCKARIR